MDVIINSKECHDIGTVIIGVFVISEKRNHREVRESNGFAHLGIAIGSHAATTRHVEGKSHSFIGHDIAMFIIHMKRRW
jgi:hypothetical protein